MNNGYIFIFLLLAAISCSQPDDKADIESIYQSLVEQKHLFYNVEYSICDAEGAAKHNLFGSVALNRKLTSGLTKAYFGIEESRKSHYLNSFFLNSDWIHNLKSNSYSLEDSDLISDSLHSPALINPALLLDIKEKADQVIYQKLNNDFLKLTIVFKNKPDQLVLSWNQAQEKLAEIEYRYAVNSENTYSRKWVFEYMSESDFKHLEVGLKQMHEKDFQAYL